MSGNVEEWCFDWADTVTGSYPSEETDPHGQETGSTRAFRGGAWNLGAFWNEIENRTAISPWLKFYNRGLRALRIQ
jgi:formylglycine-generating enzyme required for sulfatase activity